MIGYKDLDGGYARNGGEAEPEWRGLWRDLVFCAPLLEKRGPPFDIIARAPGTFPGTESWSKGQDGYGIDADFTETRRAQWNYAPVLNYPVTLYGVALQSGSTGDYRTLVDIGGSGSAARNMAIQASGAGNFFDLFRRDDGGSSEISGTTTANATARVVHGVCQSATDAKLYVDGRLDGSSVASVAFPTVDRVGVGGLVDSTPSSGHDGVILVAAIFRRGLTARECAAMAADPFGFLRQRRRRPYKAAAAPAGTTPKGVFGKAMKGPMRRAVNP